MKNDDLDRVLDDALATYSSREPLAGIEQRVLNRIRSRRPFAFLWWALPAAAVLLLLLLVPIRYHRTDRGTGTARAGLQPRPRIAQAEVPPPPLAPRVPPRHQRRRPVMPRPFPTPAPLTPEESALLAFAADAPQEARKAFAPRPEIAIDPISVPEIRIEPLKINNLP